MKLTCLRTEVESGGSKFPLYVGFANVKDLSDAAEAPAFSEGTSNAEVASNVLTPPTTAWQRPLIQASIDAMQAAYDDSGKLMPNPVLLARNPQFPNKLAVEARLEGDGPGRSQDTFEVTVPDSLPKVKPLWIIDGQHRIKALAGSAQRGNEIPFVLLLDDRAVSVYNQSRLAEIFAQVTTTAAKLNPIHQEWMEYAFELGKKYGTANVARNAELRAMETVATLCRNPVAAGEPNYFHDRIQFNPTNRPVKFDEGFGYTCVELQSAISHEYFGQALEPGVARLNPADLADQIASACWWLSKLVKASHKSVFFGDEGHRQRIMQDAFLAGVLARLRYEVAPNWEALLMSLDFHQSNWDFTPWVRTLSGRANSVSKEIAFSAFREAFRTGSLIAGSDLVDFLKGNAASCRIQLFGTSKSRRKIGTPTVLNILNGGKQTLRCTEGDSRRLQILSVSSNIGELQIRDATKSTPEGHPKFKGLSQPSLKRAGSRLTLDPALHASPLVLHLKMQFYGGIDGSAELTVEW